jgi:hypothetical protein
MTRSVEANSSLPFTVGHTNLNGTCLQGELDVPFSRVVEVFGEPRTGVDGDKVAFEWAITFADGTVASIYDYKASALYDTDNPTPEQMRAAEFADWHIGGYCRRAFELVRQALTANISRSIALTPEEEFCKALNGLCAACYTDNKGCRICGGAVNRHHQGCAVAQYELAVARRNAARTNEPAS